MSNFDMREQKVDIQNIAGRDININNPSEVNALRAELSREISALTTQIHHLNTEVTALQARVMLGMMDYLPQDVAGNLVFNPELLEDDLLMVQVSIAASSRDAFQQVEQLRSLREDYKQKNAELRSLRQHLKNLQGEMRRLGVKDVVGTIVSAFKSLIN